METSTCKTKLPLYLTTKSTNLLGCRATIPSSTMATKHAIQHDVQVDKSAGSLARIEALMAKSLAASRKYLPSWERSNSKKGLDASSTHSYRSVGPKKPSSPTRSKATIASKCNVKNQGKNRQNGKQQQQGQPLQNKTEWKPIPASSKLSGRSATQSSNKNNTPASTDGLRNKTEWK